MSIRVKARFSSHSLIAYNKIIKGGKKTFEDTDLLFKIARFSDLIYAH